MTSLQGRVARAILCLAFATTAYAKFKAVTSGAPEPFVHGHLVMILAGILECAIAGAVWTRFAMASCWAGAGLVSLGSLWYSLIASPAEGSCVCLGTFYLGPVQHAGLAGA
jgi:hypothetical protein